MRARLFRTERELSRIRMNARKQDTRRKIELGGLLIKAGLGGETSAVILGALVLAANALNGANADANRARFQAAGDAAFSANKEPHHDDDQ